MVILCSIILHSQLFKMQGLMIIVVIIIVLVMAIALVIVVVISLRKEKGEMCLAE